MTENGPGWYALRSDGTRFEEPSTQPRPLGGDPTHVRMFGEYGGQALWDNTLRLTQDREVLHALLGISYELADAINQWGVDWDEQQGRPEHNERGRALFEQLEAELKPGITAELKL